MPGVRRRDLKSLNVVSLVWPVHGALAPKAEYAPLAVASASVVMYARDPAKWPPLSRPLRERLDDLILHGKAPACAQGAAGASRVGASGRMSR
jgi:hypothetical protein